MLNSFKFFFKGFMRKTLFWSSTVLFVLSVLYKICIKPFLSVKSQEALTTTSDLVLIVIFIVVVLTFAQSYHELYTKRLTELRETIPEVKEDHIFRIFYELYKEGKSLKNADTSRRQTWDEKVFKTIRNYRDNNFKNKYLLKTGRRWGKFEPIEDDKYNEAVAIVKDCIDRDLQEI